MPFQSASNFLLALSEQSVQDWLVQAFYPTLLGILVLASLGLPIPEDVPLIAAGVVLKTHPQAASWHWTIVVALIGIMSGDLVLYSMGRRWGPGVVRLRWVRWIISEEQFERRAKQFNRYGAWFCFFGRFFMGIRGMMCIMAGATRYPYWKFFLADFAGALLSVPFFIILGFLFAHTLDQLKDYIGQAQGVVLLLVALIVVPLIAHRVFKHRMKKKHVPAEYVVDLALPPEPPAEERKSTLTAVAGKPETN